MRPRDLAESEFRDEAVRRLVEIGIAAAKETPRI
jgi:hypothetical protein